MQTPRIKTEVRKDENGEIDEVLLHVDGECVFHLETMSEEAVWFALYPDDGYPEHFWVRSKKDITITET